MTPTEYQIKQIEPVATYYRRGSSYVASIWNETTKLNHLTENLTPDGARELACRANAQNAVRSLGGEPEMYDCSGPGSVVQRVQDWFSERS